MKEDQIIAIALDILENARYRNPLELDKYIRDHMIDPNKRYYIFIDEIQFVSEIQNPYVDNKDAKITFIDVILGFMQMDNADVYVTSSNSKMLSSDILTQFRDRGDEIRVYPLSFAEFYNEYEGDNLLNIITPIWGFEMRGLDSGNWKRLILIKGTYICRCLFECDGHTVSLW